MELEPRGPDLDVRVVELRPMRGVWVRAVGEYPEREAWETLSRWARPRGLLEDPEAHPLFGWNDPPPTAGRRDYGYALWIRIGPDVEADLGADPEAGVPEALDLPGGSYAVARCRLAGDPHGSVSEVWTKLVDHVADSDLHWRGGRELERILNPGAPEDDWVLELYLPVAEGWASPARNVRRHRRGT